MALMPSKQSFINYFKLQYVCVQSLSHVWLFAALWIVACQAPLSMGFSRPGVLEWVAISFFRGSSRPRDQTWVSCIAGNSELGLNSHGPGPALASPIPMSFDFESWTWNLFWFCLPRTQHLLPLPWCSLSSSSWEYGPKSQRSSDSGLCSVFINGMTSGRTVPRRSLSCSPTQWGQ